MASLKRAVLVTGHYWGSQRRAGFHGIADALVQLGWEVLFFTSGFSWLSILRRDHRLAYPVRAEARRLLKKGDRLWSFAWFTPWHPVNLRSSLFNRLSRSLFQRYGFLPLGEAEEFIRTSRLFIFESMCGLLLWDQCRQLQPDARFVYRVSDDLRLLRAHPVVLEQEKRIAGEFDLISVPSRDLLRAFAGSRNVKLLRHGICKELFDRDYPNPYGSSERPHAVFVGTSYLDVDFLKRASRLFPDWRFHIIGPIARLPKQPNVIAYGEMRQEDTIPFIKHAQIGLQTLTYFPGAESLSDSLKMIQYTYCGLAVVAPSFLAQSHGHAFAYEPGDDTTIRQALLAARTYDRSLIRSDGVASWTDVANDLVGSDASVCRGVAS